MSYMDCRLGEQLRSWRQRRRMSQLDLACEADISTKHLSFIETGRSAPSREMVARLAASLDLPPRERNALLIAAGFAPDVAERPFDHPSLAAARAAVERIIDGHLPFPALAVDRHWNLLHANAAVHTLIEGVAGALLVPQPNVLRLSLHPEGLAPRIANLAEWKAHLLARLGGQVRASGDPQLAALLEELKSYPAPASSGHHQLSEVASPLILDSPAGPLSFLSTTTVFGTAVEVTLSEVTIESFFPADEATSERLKSLR
ncbi:helix-turn-helix domain-containing protein [Sphingomonas piscis]|uniref:Helix-turn-helix domain-containing protein n=1 Tax=Sphingomonas piscis TaxID=2714943 RepID=A0A6G7YMY1_9SPHN|nr:helix-turn-helix transcriptional regulator [Sphingomonas piscis]QIK78100.1 helix-turn-helix domain-containing protein [Sphingomonas piscis]